MAKYIIWVDGFFELEADDTNSAKDWATEMTKDIQQGNNIKMSVVKK